MRIVRKLASVSVAAAALAGALFTSPALAADATSTNFFVPTHVYAGYNDGSIFIGGATYVGTAACVSPNILKVKLDSSNVMSLALAAMLAGKEVQCAVNGCEGNYPLAHQCKIR